MTTTTTVPNIQVESWSLNQLKNFALAHGIEVSGDRRRKDTFIAAIKAVMKVATSAEAKAAAIAVARVSFECAKFIAAVVVIGTVLGSETAFKIWVKVQPFIELARKWAITEAQVQMGQITYEAVEAVLMGDEDTDVDKDIDKDDTEPAVEVIDARTTSSWDRLTEIIIHSDYLDDEDSELDSAQWFGLLEGELSPEAQAMISEIE